MFSRLCNSSIAPLVFSAQVRQGGRYCRDVSGKYEFGGEFFPGQSLDFGPGCAR